jgi:prolyl oligopeptidase
MDDDPYLWLEETGDERTNEWVRRHNDATFVELNGERLERMRTEALAISNANDRIPTVERRGEYLYNFWLDAEHPRGTWRRTTLEQYLTDATTWDVIIDVDALAATEDENWLWRGAELIDPEYTRAFITLSRGGAAESVSREFDMLTREFVTDGFNLSEAKSDLTWEDENTVLVSTDFGEGSMSAAGLALVIKRWRRGKPLDDAEWVFTGSAGDLAAFALVDRTPGYERTLFIRQTDNTHRKYLVARDGELVALDVPPDAPIFLHREWLVISLPTVWTRNGTTYQAGTLLVADFDDFLAGTAELRILHEPDEHTSLVNLGWTRDHLAVLTMEDVASRVLLFTTNTWEVTPLPGVPDNTEVSICAVDPHGDEIFLVAGGFDRPPRLLHGHAGGTVAAIKSTPPRFDADDLVVSQHFASSADGTRIPYFLVTHRDSTEPGPTVLAGYGSFAISQRPGYLGTTGRLWLERGGNYAMANVRGGAEYGPDWYLQSIRAGRHRVAEDFAAVAADLIERGVTTPSQLGGVGASAGGLLMGVMLTQYPELFGALLCRHPLLDMRRFHLLGMGSAYVAEYGAPDDPADWEFISKYSPYHNIRAGRTYPPIMITTSTNDTRSHPGHARKMAAALDEAGHRVLFHEVTEGGHGAANNAQAAESTALNFEFLHRALHTDARLGLGA